MSRSLEEQADAVLGCALLNDEACMEVLEGVDPQMLPRRRQRVVLEAIRSLVAAGDQVDPAAVVGHLSVKGWLDTVGGASVVFAMSEKPVVISNAPTYVAQLQTMHHEKLTQYAVNQLNQVTGATVDERAAAVSSVFEQLSAQTQTQSGVSDIGDVIDDVLSPQDDSESWSVNFPWPSMNREKHGGGWGAGNIVVIGGYTGAGKSWAGLQMIREASLKGKRSLLVSIEMTKREMGKRLLVMEGLSEYEDTLHGDRADRIDELRKWPVQIMQDRADFARVRNWYNREKVRGRKIDVVVIDHLHLLDIPVDNYRLQLNRLLDEFKEFAMKENVAIVILTQFRNVEGAMPGGEGTGLGARTTEYPRPTMNSLRESSAIKQIADYVFLLWRVPDPQSDEQTRRGLVINKKVRGGEERGSFEISFDDRCRFMEIAGGQYATV